MPLQTFQNVLSITITSGGVFDAYDLIGFAGTKVASDDAAVLGVALSPATASGEPVAVMVQGVARVKNSGGVSAGQRVMSASTGGVKAATAPDMGATPPDLGAANAFAIALASANNNEFVDILLTHGRMA